MRATTLLATLALVLLLPAASARLPVGCGYSGPCVSVIPPTGVPSAVECHEVVTTVGTTSDCAVGNGAVFVETYGCQYCLPLTVLACQEGTQGTGCGDSSILA
jgi:hypothetical protein